MLQVLNQVTGAITTYAQGRGPGCQPPPGASAGHRACAHGDPEDLGDDRPLDLRHGRRPRRAGSSRRCCWSWVSFPCIPRRAAPGTPAAALIPIRRWTWHRRCCKTEGKERRTIGNGRQWDVYAAHRQWPEGVLFASGLAARQVPFTEIPVIDFAPMFGPTPRRSRRATPCVTPARRSASSTSRTIRSTRP